MQRQLDFPTRRGRELMDIRQVKLGNMILKLCLRTIDDHLGSGRSTWDMSMCELAEEMECHPGTAYRACAMLRDAGVLELVPLGGRKFRFRLIRGTIADLIETGRTVYQPDSRRAARREKPVAQNDVVAQNDDSSRKTTDSSRCATDTTIGRTKDAPKDVGGCTELSKTKDSAPAGDGDPRASHASEYSFPCHGKAASWVLPTPKLQEYRDTFPELDIDAELRKARQWCRDNPARRKTASGMLSFLTRWLSNSQNRGSGANGRRGNSTSQYDAAWSWGRETAT